MLGAVALEGGESFGEQSKAVGIILRVAGAMVTGILHGGTVAFVLSIFFNPKASELMPLNQS